MSLNMALYMYYLLLIFLLSLLILANGLLFCFCED